MYHKIKFDKVKTFSYGFEHPVLLVCVFVCNLRSVKMKGRIMIVDYLCSCNFFPDKVKVNNVMGEIMC
jgi:hypothetical protein